MLNENFDPLLHKAAAQGNSDMLQLFIENRANVNLQEKTTERTALHEAMDQGLCIMGPDLSGSSTRLIVCKRADSPFAQTLAAARASRKRKRGRVRLHVVADNMETHPAGWMNPNSKTEHDKIALHMALAQGHTSVVRQLLIFKADIWLKQEVSAKNALDIAIELANATKPRLSQAPDPPPRAIQGLRLRLRKCCGLDISHVGDEHGNAGHVESLVHNMAIKHEIANGVLAALRFLEQHGKQVPRQTMQRSFLRRSFLSVRGSASVEISSKKDHLRTFRNSVVNWNACTACMRIIDVSVILVNVSPAAER